MKTNVKQLKEQIAELVLEVLEEELSAFEKELQDEDASKEFANKHSVIKMTGDQVYEDGNDPPLFKKTRPADEVPPKVAIAWTSKRELSS